MVFGIKVGIGLTITGERNVVGTAIVRGIVVFVGVLPNTIFCVLGVKACMVGNSGGGFAAINGINGKFCCIFTYSFLSRKKNIINKMAHVFTNVGEFRRGKGNRKTRLGPRTV